jgi:hypothetical protein
MTMFTFGAQEMYLELNFLNSFMWLFIFVGESMVKYIKIFDKKKSSLKRGNFCMKIQ